MTNAALFGDDDNQIEDTNTQVDNPLEVLVGEGKKFKTVEELAKGKLESDRFIAQLQAEKRALLEEKNTRERLEELVNKLSNPSPSNVPTPQAREAENPVTPSNGLTKEDLEKLLSERERQRTAEQNVQLVKTELEKSFGSNWKSNIAQKAKELNLSPQQMTDLASQSPQLVLSLFNRQPAPKVPTPPGSHLNTATLGTNESVRDWNYYERLRKEDPKTYYSAAVQKEVLQAWQKFNS